MGFFDKIKEGINKIKEENKGFGAAMKRINAPGYCGNFNRAIKDGDFWMGSYISIEGGKGVIYGSNQEDYFFGGDDVEAFTLIGPTTVRSGDKNLPALRFSISFKDGKKGEFDIFTDKLDMFKQALNLI